MSRRATIAHQYVEFIPKELDEGIIYISQRFNTASHLCCCGCGLRVVTPFNTAKWRLNDHGSTISLSPSIGLGKFPCRSHYWIRQSRIDWCLDMTEQQAAWAERADEYASQIYTGEKNVHETATPSSTKALRNLQKALFSWFRSIWK